MNWTLEVVVVPVTDVDRAKSFYMDKLGFKLDVDRWTTPSFRVVQLTPPGSACSIALLDPSPAEPGSVRGLQLVVKDVRAARAELAARGFETGEVVIFDSSGQRAARDGDDLNFAGFIFFNDPDGNSWAVQQITARD